MATIYEEAAQTIVDADRAAAEKVAQRALDEGLTPADVMQHGSSPASTRSASCTRAARSSCPS